MSKNRDKIVNRRRRYIRRHHLATSRKEELNAVCDYLRSAVCHLSEARVAAVVEEVRRIAEREEEDDDRP